MPNVKRALKIAGTAAVLGAGAIALARARKNSEWKRAHASLSKELEAQGLRAEQVFKQDLNGKTVGFKVDIAHSDMAHDTVLQAYMDAGQKLAHKHSGYRFLFDANTHEVLVKLSRSSKESRASLVANKQLLHYDPVKKEWILSH